MELPPPCSLSWESPPPPKLMIRPPSSAAPAEHHELDEIPGQGFHSAMSEQGGEVRPSLWANRQPQGRQKKLRKQHGSMGYDHRGLDSAPSEVQAAAEWHTHQGVDDCGTI